jgi:cell wall-associated NlpC family hydrolase
MCLKQKTFLKITVFLCIFIVLAACAPKKVRLYGVSGIIGGSDPIRSNVVVSALAMQGKPYKNGAKGPDAFDCSGFVYYVFKQHVLLPPPAEAQARAGREIDRNGTLPGDLVLFKIDGDFHIGIVVTGTDFVHASKSRGVAIDSVDATYWRKRLVGFRSVL